MFQYSALKLVSDAVQQPVLMFIERAGTPPRPKKKKRAETPTDRLIEKINEMEEKREARHNRHMHLLEHLAVAYEKKCA